MSDDQFAGQPALGATQPSVAPKAASATAPNLLGRRPNVLSLAWRYVWFHKLKSLVLIACIFLTALLPIAVRTLLLEFNRALVARADSTPAVIGAKGSELDLTLGGLYFKPKVAGSIPFAEANKVRESQLATAIPLHLEFTAQGFPLVGTTLEYFEFRNLNCDRGTLFTTLGDCVIGQRVANELGLEPGDRLLSDRENVLNIAGQSPIKLLVVGVLAANDSADDRAVFVDLKTAWVVQGLGHGHQDLTNEDANSPKLLSKSGNRIVANRSVVSFIEITSENIDSFHFHGNVDDFPISCIIAVAASEKNETLLQGRYDASSSQVQFARPALVVRELMTLVFRVKTFFDANAILIAFSTALLLMLVILLSLKLRQREMETMYKIGCSRGTIALLQLSEMLIIFGVAAVLLTVAVVGVTAVAGDLIQSYLVAFDK